MISKNRFYNYANLVVEVVTKQQAVIDMLNKRINKLESIELERQVESEMTKLSKQFGVALDVNIVINRDESQEVVVSIVDCKSKIKVAEFCCREELLDNLDTISDAIKVFLYDYKTSTRPKKGDK